jgi:hypothetical protein
MFFEYFVSAVGKCILYQLAYGDLFDDCMRRNAHERIVTQEWCIFDRHMANRARKIADNQFIGTPIEFD